MPPTERREVRGRASIDPCESCSMADVETSPPSSDSVLRVVDEFYEANPFPGFDPGEYETRGDLVQRASWYAQRVDAEIPFEASVVDVGCGTGQLACYLALKGRSVLGVDYSQHSLSLAQIFERAPCAPDGRVPAGQPARVGSSPRARSTSCSATAYCTTRAIRYGGFRKLVRIAKPGGRIIVGLYNRYGRLMLLARRRVVSLLSRFDPGGQGPGNPQAADHARQRRCQAAQLVRGPIRASARIDPHG